MFDKRKPLSSAAVVVSDTFITSSKANTSSNPHFIHTGNGNLLLELRGSCYRVNRTVGEVECKKNFLELFLMSCTRVHFTAAYFALQNLIIPYSNHHTVPG